MTARTIQQILALLLIGLIAFLDFQMLAMFLRPMAWATILSIVFWDAHRWISKRTKGPNKAALLSTVVVLFAILTPLFVVAAGCLQQGVALLQDISQAQASETIHRGVDWVTKKLPIEQGDLQEQFDSFSKTGAAFLAQRSTILATGLAQFAFRLVITLIGVYYLLRDGPQLLRWMKDVSPLGEQTTATIFQSVGDLVKVTVRSNFVVVTVQGAIAGGFFWALGIPSPMFWAVVTAVFGFIPVLAAVITPVGGAIYLFATGQVGNGLIMLVGAVIVSTIDNILRPMLISDRAKLHGLVALLSVFGGIFAFGFLGIVMGPVLAAITLGLLQGFRESVRSAPQEPRDAIGAGGPAG